MDKDSGRVLTDQALAVPAEPPSASSALSGFDPSRGPCAACRERGKTWEGSDPNCAFPNGGEFDPDNWNCATANRIRSLMPRWEPVSEWISGPHWNEDQYWATVNLSGGLSDTLAEDAIWETLWVSWYKSRGRTEAMWLLSCDCPPRRPTEAEAVAIAQAIEARSGETGNTGSTEGESAVA